MTTTTPEVIHKFGPLRDAAVTVDDMPAGGRIISTGVQDGKVWVWAIVRPDAAHQPRRLHLVATGTQVPDTAGRLVGLAFFHDGTQRVFHVFEDITTQVALAEYGHGMSL